MLLIPEMSFHKFLEVPWLDLTLSDNQDYEQYYSEPDGLVLLNQGKGAELLLRQFRKRFLINLYKFSGSF